METTEEDSEKLTEASPENKRSLAAEDGIDLFTRGSKAITAGVVAATGLMTLFGIIEIVAFSFQEPSGFPRFEPSSLAELLVPIALSGAFIITTISVALGLPGYIFGNYELPLNNRDKVAPKSPFDMRPPQDKDVTISVKGSLAVTSVMAEKRAEAVSHKLEIAPHDISQPLIFFGLLGLESILWYVLNALGTVIESNWSKIGCYYLLAAVNSAVFSLGTLAILPIPAVFFTELISSKFLKIHYTSWPTRLVQGFSGIVWLLPFIFIAGIAATSTKSQTIFWLYLVVLTIVAVVGNSIASVRRNAYRAFGALLILVVTLIVSPRALLGAPLRALGMVDATRILTIKEDERGEFNSLVESCKSIVAVDIPKQSETKNSAPVKREPIKALKISSVRYKSMKSVMSAPRVLIKYADAEASKSKPIARHRVLIENELGKDLVLECNPPGKGRQWVTVSSELIFSREPG